MKADFGRAMQEALRRTQSGQLRDATEAIQAALSGRAAAPAAARDGVVDVPGAGDIVDVVARVVPDAETSTDAVQPVDAGRAAAAAGTAPERGAASGESFTAGSFRNDCGARDFKLYLPPGHGDGRARPLVVMLHGCTQDPDDFARGTRMNTLAREHGVLVLYPAQSKRANAQGCWSWFKHNHRGRGRGEPGVIAGLVRDVMARHGVDRDRVFVAGLSAGGAMAAILGQAHPELFAAIGVHSGLAAGVATDLPSGLALMRGIAPPAATAAAPTAVPTIVFHGDADATVDASNAARLVAATGASGPSTSQRGESAGRAWTRQVFDAGRVEQWTLHGAGHAWSGGSTAGSYADARGPDASAQILRFFLAQPRRT